MNRNITQSGLVDASPIVVTGVIVNSHTSGTIRFLNGKKATIATKAYSTITSNATNVTDGKVVVIDNITYRFKNTLAQAYDIKIGASASATLDNLKAGINGSGTDGTEYYKGTNAHPTVIATTKTATTLLVTAYTTKAFIGNAIVTTTDETTLSWTAGTMAGGVDGSEAFMNTYTFPSGSGTYPMPKDFNFSDGCFAIVGGTLDCTVVYDFNI
jgi:hypothetical protein